MLCSVLCALYSVFCVLCSVIINDVCCSSCAPWPTPLPVFFERRSHHAPKRCTIVQALVRPAFGRWFPFSLRFPNLVSWETGFPSL
eukprot:COSAG06_NODE_2441_length_6871_cov_9.359716_2_plen_86_part_00